MQLQNIYLGIFKCVSKLKSQWKLSVKETQKVEEQRNPPDDVIESLHLRYQMIKTLSGIQSVKLHLCCDLGS